MKVDSLGGCLHNTDLPEEMRKPIYNDHGTSMRWKVEVFKDYKYHCIVYKQTEISISMTTEIRSYI